MNKHILNNSKSMQISKILAMLLGRVNTQLY